MQANSKNEKVKRRYLKWMREARGYSESTIRVVEGAIWLYEDFTEHEDFSKFNQRNAIRLKNWMMQRKHNGEPISITTTYGQLRHLKEFFTWLSAQPGYKSRISLDSVSYLSLDKRKVREATAPRAVKFPSLDYVRELVGSIQIDTEIDMREPSIDLVSAA